MTQSIALLDSLSELDSESSSEQELSRLTVLVGAMMLDVGLPTQVNIGAVIDDVVALANDQLALNPDTADVRFDETPGLWTLAKIGGEPIDPGRSLAEAQVFDGDVLVVAKTAAPTAPLLFDDVDDAGWGSVGLLRRLLGVATDLVWFVVGVAAAVTAATLLPGQAALGPVAAGATLAVGSVAVLVACATARRDRGQRASAYWAAVGLPLTFGGALYVVPGAHGVSALPMAIGLTGFGALLILLISRRNRAPFTAVIAAAVLTTPAAVAELVWDPNPRALGALLATVSVITVYLSPRLTIAMAKLPIPRVPTAGEPLDDIETQGGTTVEGVNAIGKQVIPTEEGMSDRVRRANEYLTGILVAAAVCAALGCYLAVDVSNGFFWQGTAFAASVATVLCLRGRSHHDLVQAATTIGAGLTIALATIAKNATYLESWRVDAALALVLLTVVVTACGVVAPRIEFSPVQRRLVEIGEYLAIATVFPLCFWIVGVYAYFRELSL